MPRNFSRLSHSYFWYFAILGLAIPFLALFLEGRGFDSLAMGEILAMFTATKIIGPIFWSFLADKTGKKLPYIQLSSTLALASFIGLFFANGYWSIMLALALFSLFWTGMQPQMEVLTLATMRNSSKLYARIRLWGSIGFITFAIISGEIINLIGSNSFIWLGTIILFSLWLSTLFLKEKRERVDQAQQQDKFIQRLIVKNFILFFTAGVLFQLSFGPYYSFFALFLRDLNYPSYAVGALISIAVAAEIIFFMLAGRFFKWFNYKYLIVFSMVITAIRWWIMGYWGDNALLLVVIQLAHAASFGAYHSASLQFIQAHFNENQQNRAQAIYVSGVYGIGGSLGAYLAGVYWQDGAGAQQTFFYAGVIAFISGVLALFIKHKRHNV